jgi:phosphoribosylformylglycinamidine synthase
MRIKVFVSLKDVVLDPQGQAVLNAINKLGYDFVNDVRVGKMFELDVDDRTIDIRKKVEEISEKLLSNPIIEEFNIEMVSE